MKPSYTLLMTKETFAAADWEQATPAGFCLKFKTVERKDFSAALTNGEADGLILLAEQAGVLTGVPGDTAALILADKSTLTKAQQKFIPAGCMVCVPDELPAVLPQLLAGCVRLRALRTRTDTLERKLDDTKLVARAKLLLMTRLNMSETQAHRYIEKTAMDSGSKKRDIAERIIRTYEE